MVSVDSVQECVSAIGLVLVSCIRAVPKIFRTYPGISDCSYIGFVCLLHNSRRVCDAVFCNLRLR